MPAEALAEAQKRVPIEKREGGLVLYSPLLHLMFVICHLWISDSRFFSLSTWTCTNGSLGEFQRFRPQTNAAFILILSLSLSVSPCRLCLSAILRLSASWTEQLPISLVL